MKLCSIQNNDTYRDIRKKQFNLHSQQKLVFRELLRKEGTVNFKQQKYYRLVSHGVPSEFRTQVWGSLIRNVKFITPVQYQTKAGEIDGKIREFLAWKEINIGKVKGALDSTLTQNESKIEWNSSETASETSASKQLDQPTNKIFTLLTSIDQDLPRTFPDLLNLHNDPEYYKKLTRSLCVSLSLFDDISYIQGMTQIGALLLMQTDNEFQSFVAMTTIISSSPLSDFYKFSHTKIQGLCNKIQDKIKQKSSQLWHVLIANEIQIKMLVISWIMTMFTRCFQIDSLLNIWDILLLNDLNQNILQQLCVALALSRKKAVNACDNPSKMVKLLMHAKLELVEEEFVLEYLRALPRSVS